MTMTIHGVILPLFLSLLASFGLQVDCCSTEVQGEHADRGEAIDWTGSYARALEMARETGKPILLEFRCLP